MAAASAAALAGAGATALGLTTAAAIASILDSAAASIANEIASRELEQAKNVMMLARKGHDIMGAGI